MGRFLLLAGVHYGADKTKEPAVSKAPSGDLVERYPSRQYSAGEIVESDQDLVSLFGNEKFSYADERKGQRAFMSAPNPLDNPSVAPGGQVTTGYQATVRLPNGQTVARALRADEFERFFGKPEEYAVSAEKAEAQDRETMRRHSATANPPLSSSQEVQQAGRPDESWKEGEEPEVDPRTAPIEERYNLADMSVRDLKALADSEGIDVAGATTKKEIIEKLRAGER